MPEDFPFPDYRNVKPDPDIEGEVTDEKLTRQLLAIYRVRGPKRLFEWASTLILLGCVVWPVVFGKPLTSVGSQQLAEAGLHPRHLAVFMGFLGCARVAILVYYGTLGGWCPWIRATIAMIAAMLWCQFWIASAFTTAELPTVSIGIPIYFGLLIGELLVCVRAVIDARYPINN